MKKKYLKSLLIVSLLVLSIFITGCDKKENKEKTSNMKTVEIKDEKAGINTTFKYNKADGYEVTNIDTDSGKYVQVTVENKEKNIEIEMYYFETLDTSYNKTKDSRSNSDGYKEYTWNGYEGYSYNGDKYKIDFNILLKKDTEKMDIGLFGTISYIDYNDADVMNVFESEDFQKFMNTIEFKEN